MSIADAFSAIAAWLAQAFASPKIEYELQMEFASARSESEDAFQDLLAAQPAFRSHAFYYDRPWQPPQPKEWSIWKLVEGQPPEFVRGTKAGAPHVFGRRRSDDEDLLAKATDDARGALAIAQLRFAGGAIDGEFEALRALQKPGDWS